MAYMGSGPFMTGAPGFSGSYTMPVPIGFQVKSKLGIELQVSCVQISLVSIVKGHLKKEKEVKRKYWKKEKLKKRKKYKCNFFFR